MNRTFVYNFISLLLPLSQLCAKYKVCAIFFPSLLLCKPITLCNNNHTDLHSWKNHQIPQNLINICNLHTAKSACTSSSINRILPAVAAGAIRHNPFKYRDFLSRQRVTFSKKNKLDEMETLSRGSCVRSNTASIHCKTVFKLRLLVSLHLNSSNSMVCFKFSMFGIFQIQ